MAEKFVFRGVEFHAGMHLWSNPKLLGTPAEIPVILARPTLFDVVQLAKRYPLEALRQANRRLRTSREISERQFLRTQEILRNVERATADSTRTIDDALESVAAAHEEPVMGECSKAAAPTPEQRRRALAAWLPGGLPIVTQAGQQYIRLADVPLELETVVRRWLRWQLGEEPAIASRWLMDNDGQLALSHLGWCAFVSWTAEALHHRLDQVEIGM